MNGVQPVCPMAVHQARYFTSKHVEYLDRHALGLRKFVCDRRRIAGRIWIILLQNRGFFRLIFSAHNRRRIPYEKQPFSRICNEHHIASHGQSLPGGRCAKISSLKQFLRIGDVDHSQAVDGTMKVGDNYIGEIPLECDGGSAAAVGIIGTDRPNVR